MNILVLGGTQFLGRHFVDAALTAGHKVTTFTRGQTNPGLQAEAEALIGDRDGGLDLLRERTWEAVIDTSGYVPRVVRDSVNLLSESVARYLFVSTISVYADFSKPVDESSEVGQLEDRSVETVDGETYGPLKALCEQEVTAAFGDRATVVRPGLIVGPHDPTDRFTYWPVRVSLGGRILAPGRPERTIQLIDVRDLADWMLRLVVADTAGVFNATGLDPPITMGDLLEECRRVGQVDAELVWMNDEFLLDKGAGPWMELPLWIPEVDTDTAGLMHSSISRALEAGLTFRPLQQTVADTLIWFRSVAGGGGAPRRSTNSAGLLGDDWKAGMSPEKERELLEDWAKTR